MRVPPDWLGTGWLPVPGPVCVTTWRPDTCGCELHYAWERASGEDSRVHAVLHALELTRDGDGLSNSMRLHVTSATCPDHGAPGRTGSEGLHSKPCLPHANLVIDGCAYQASGDHICAAHGDSCLAATVVGENQRKNRVHASVSDLLPDHLRYPPDISDIVAVIEGSGKTEAEVRDCIDKATTAVRGRVIEGLIDLRYHQDGRGTPRLLTLALHPVVNDETRVKIMEAHPDLIVG